MWKDWLALSKREQKGFIVLSILLFLLIVFYFSIPFIFHPDNTSVSDDLLQAWIDSTKKLNHPSETTAGPLFYFDPNTIKINKLEELGVKGAALINWLKFRESGQKFRKPEDIMKVHSLDPALGQELIKYARTSKGPFHVNYSRKPETSGTQSKKSASDTPVQYVKTKHAENNKERTPLIIEINSADSADFFMLKGIGPVLSARIVAYRKALGGFFSADQLKEVYGMPEETVEKNLYLLTVDTTKIKTINVNKASLRQLKAHPYINFYMAKAIVEYRKDNYPVKNINEILSLEKIKNKHKRFLEKYLTVK